MIIFPFHLCIFLDHLFLTKNHLFQCTRYDILFSLATIPQLHYGESEVTNMVQYNDAVSQILLK